MVAATADTSALVPMKRVIDVLSLMADANPLAVYHQLPQIEAAVKSAPAGFMGPAAEWAAVLASCGAVNAKYAEQALPLVLAQLKPQAAPAAGGSGEGDGPRQLTEMEAVAFLSAALTIGRAVGLLLGDAKQGAALLNGTAGLEECARELKDTGPGGMAQGAAGALLAFMSGNDAEALALDVDRLEKRCDELNGRVTGACADWEQVKAFMEENVREVKDFIADIVKKLPQPSGFGVDGKAKRSLRLKFTCCHSVNGVCQHHVRGAGAGDGTGEAFECVTNEWAKWVKVGMSLLSVGKAALDIGLGNPLGLLTRGASALKEIYGHHKNEEDKDFNTFISQPFLTSAESDNLIGQLRSSSFFSHFDYDAQAGGWSCHACTEAGGAAGAAAAAEAAAAGDGAGAGAGAGAGGTGGDGGAAARAKHARVALVPVPLAQLRRRGVGRKASTATAVPPLLLFECASVGAAEIDALLKARGVGSGAQALAEDESGAEEILSAFGLHYDAFDSGRLVSGATALLAAVAADSTSDGVRSAIGGMLTAWAASEEEQEAGGLDGCARMQFVRAVGGAGAVYAAAFGQLARGGEGATELADSLVNVINFQASIASDEQFGRSRAVLEGGVSFLVAVLGHALDKGEPLAEEQESVVGTVLSLMQQFVMKARRVLKGALGVFIQCVQAGSAAFGASTLQLCSSFLTLTAMEAPRLLAPHVRALLALYDGAEGAQFRASMGPSILAMLLSYNPRPFTSHAAAFVGQLGSGGELWGAFFMALAEYDGACLAPHVDALVNHAKKQQIEKVVMVMALTSIARAEPADAGRDNVLQKHLPAVKVLCAGGTSQSFYIGLVAACARTNLAYTEATLAELMALVTKPGSSPPAPPDGFERTLLTVALYSAKTFISAPKEQLAPFIDALREMGEHGTVGGTDVGSYSKVAAGDLVAQFEGRALTDIAARVAEVDGNMDGVEEELEKMTRCDHHPLAGCARRHTLTPAACFHLPATSVMSKTTSRREWPT
jgi:hypothetical protein